MSVLPAFLHSSPATVTDAVAQISDESLPYAGGTELLLAMRAGFLRPERLVDLKRLDELQQITTVGSAVVIGAAVTHRRAASSATVSESFPMLASVLNRVGNARVRSTGTLAGNLCFAEPKSDVAPALIALNATVTLQSGTTTRPVMVEDFIIGPYTTVRSADELLVSIMIPLGSTTRAAYYKYQTMERPTVCVAASLSENRARIVIGAIGPVPQVYDGTDLAALDPEEIAAQLDVIADLTGAEDYKRHIATLSIRRVLTELESV